MAFEFYRSVVGTSVDPRTASVSLTGHSMGGGLAGLVASVYGKTAAVFDTMAFKAAATNAYSYANTYIPPVTIGGISNYAQENQRLAFKNAVFGTLTPWSTTNSSKIIGAHLKGELLDGMVGGRNPGNSQGIPEAEYTLGYDPSSLSIGPVDLHSMASLVMVGQPPF